MDKSVQLPVKFMILIALVQGLCLLYLHHALTCGYWPESEPQWLLAFYSIVFIWPTMLLLGLNESNGKAFIKLTLPFGLMSGLLGYYIGYQVDYLDGGSSEVLLCSFVLTLSIATFKTLMYSQQLALGTRLTYSALFIWSWRNFLTLSLSLLFVGSFCLILLLWALLFKAVGIEFFSNLFMQAWFCYPALALANGVGVIIFRSQAGIIDTINRLQQTLMKFLLVVLVLVSLLFLCALSFTGLDPLWDSGGSLLILCMHALLLFFVNAVYRDEADNWPYALWLHRFIALGVAILPIYSLISYYGVSERLEQYGWSLSRYWAFLVWFLLALFSIGYCWGIAKYRDGWVRQLSSVNVASGLIVLALMLLVNTPLLDFRKMVVADQLQRLADNKITFDDFDIGYLRGLGKPGDDALQALKVKYGENHPRFRGPKPIPTREKFIAAITLLSGTPPDLLLTTIYQYATNKGVDIEQAQKWYLQELDLDNDGKAEYLWIEKYQYRTEIILFNLEKEHWESLEVEDWRSDQDNFDRFYKSLSDGSVKAVSSRWNDIMIGDQRFQIRMDK